MKDSFSRRNAYSPASPPIKVREDAPQELREAIILIAYEVGFSPKFMRELICNVLLRFPDSNNWSAQNIKREIQKRILDCEWFKVYDIAENFYSAAVNSKVPLVDEFDNLYEEPDYEARNRARGFQSLLNEFFTANGIGWQMEDGKIVVRGSESFEDIVHEAEKKLHASGRPTAASEITEARRDLSRRPEADRTGAIQHSMAALECLARDLCGDSKATLGTILKSKNEELGIPRPLDGAVEKTWGYASELGRHIMEGRTPGYAEAELVVMLSASLVSYLLCKKPESNERGGDGLF